MARAAAKEINFPFGRAIRKPQEHASAPGVSGNRDRRDERHATACGNGGEQRLQLQHGNIIRKDQPLLNAPAADLPGKAVRFMQHQNPLAFQERR